MDPSEPAHQKLADLSSALRFTADQAISLRRPRSGTLNSAFTLQAWVRPTAPERGVLAFAAECFHGHGVPFKAGRYDDLAGFRVGSEAVASLRVPPGWRAVIFKDSGCTGAARLLDKDTAALGAEWQAAAQSMLVLDLSDLRPRFAVVFRDAAFKGPALVLGLGRCDDTTQLGAAAREWGSVMVPAGLALTLHDQPGCQGAARTLVGDVAELDAAQGPALGALPWARRVRSLALTSDGERSVRKSAPPQRVGIFTAASGQGLGLDIVQPDSPVLPVAVQFMGERLAADRWHHIAIAFGNGQSMACLNGHALNTTPPKGGFDLSGEWMLGQDYAGEIGLVSVHDTAWTAQQLAARRFEVPRQGDAGLVACWALEGSGKQWLLELQSGTKSAMPVADAFWVSAKFPRSMLDTGVARQALSVATQAGNESLHKARLAGQAELEHARLKAQGVRRRAQAHAQAQLHASRIQRVLCIAAGNLAVRGPHGAVLAPPPWSPRSVPRAVCLDVAAGVAIVAEQGLGGGGSFIRQVLHNAPQGLPQSRLHETPQTVHALALVPDDALGRRFLYWIESPGVLMRLGDPKAGPPQQVARLAGGREGSWSLAADPARNRMFWSNGREIWCGSWNPGPGSASRADFDSVSIVVSQGQSPHPVALAVDPSNGDLYWLDKELQWLRALPNSRNRIRDVYEALAPRAGLAIDVLDLSKLPPAEAAHPALQAKRLYWNAEHRQQLEVAVIDDPGLFCWLQHLEPHPTRHNNVPALEDTHLVGVRWHAVDMPRQVGGPDTPTGVIRGLVGSAAHAVFAVVQTAIGEFGSWVEYGLWNSSTRTTKPLFRWERDRQGGDSPLVFAMDKRRRRLIHMRLLWPSVVDLTEAGKSVDLRGLHPSGTYIRSVAITPDGSLAVLASTDTTLSVWDTDTGKPVRQLAGHHVEVHVAHCYEHQGRNYALSGGSDGAIKQWDLATGECLRTLRGHTATVTYLAATPDGQRVVSASADQTLKVWHLATGTCQRTLTGHTSWILHIWILADGRRALSSAMDKTVKLWDLDSGACQRTFSGHTALARQAMCSDDGLHLLSRGDAETLQWLVDPLQQSGALAFAGGDDHVDLGPLYLDCRHGFAMTMLLRVDTASADMTLLSLGNGADGSNLLIMRQRDGLIALATGDPGASLSVTVTDACKLALKDWHSLSISIDPTGQASLSVDGQPPVLSALLNMLPPGLRLHNLVGRANTEPRMPLVGEVAALRLWNRTLSAAEVAHFHAEPLAPPQGAARAYHRSMMDYRHRRPSLMSGMADGSTPAVPLFDLAVDQGLEVQTATGLAHARLVAAQHDLHVAQERATARRAAEEQAAHARLAVAHAHNQDQHEQAQQILRKAAADADLKRAEVQRRKAAAQLKSQQQIDASTQAAKRQKELAEQQAAQLTTQARIKAAQVKRDANGKLQSARDEKAKYS